MIRSLSVNEKLTLSSAGTETVFTIDEVMGAGGSCIAYKVTYTENGNIVHKGILKEYFPFFLTAVKTPLRNGTSVNVPEVFASRFSEGLYSFKETYRGINDYLSNNLSAANFHTVQLGLFIGNNTAYTLTSCDYGLTYDKLTDNDAFSLFKLMYSVTKAVELYHTAGFLHLDIKPKNILVLDEVTDIVKLFDFDSLIPIQKIKDRTFTDIPSPGEYHVSELVERNVRKIGIHTDVFEIGAMVFKRLFGRYPTPQETTYNTVHDLDKAKLLEGVSPQAKHEIETLLKKTLQTTVELRYQTTAELKKQLKKIAELIGSDEPYLVDLPKWQPTNSFVGRSDDLREIDRRLQDDGYVFIKGIGGLGKSEITKYYAKKYSSKYHTVQFCKYEDSLKSVVASLAVSGVDESRFTSFDELVRHKNKILHTCDKHTLLIVDNFNVTHDKFLRDFLPSNNSSFKVIFTTRCNLEADYYEDKILRLSKLSMEECKKIYSVHSRLDTDDGCAEKIIETVDYNTLVLVLLAKTIRKSRKDPSEILELLESQELNSEQSMIFHEYDYSSEETEDYAKIYSHLNVIYDVSGILPVEKQLLKNMTLVSHYGITSEDLLDCCECSDFSEDTVAALVNSGWLEYRYDRLIMHPIVSDLVAANEDIPADDSYYNLADCIEYYCDASIVEHISIETEKIACATHLDRRYKHEDAGRRIMIKAIIGNLYFNLFQAKNARKAYFDAEALAIESGKRDYLPFIYNLIGEHERRFGTISKAIEWFMKAAEEAKKHDDCDEELLISTVFIADCKAENGDMHNAFTYYSLAYTLAKDNSLDSYIGDIASRLIDACADLGMKEQVEKYTKILETASEFADEDSEEENKCHEALQLESMGDFAGSIEKLESFLEDAREQFGEDSPEYKANALDLWTYYILANDSISAKRLATQDMAFIEEYYGSDSMKMADHLATVGAKFSDIMEFDYAIECAKRAIEICEMHDQSKSKAALEARLALAKCYIMQGRIDEAKEAYNDVDFSLFSGADIIFDVLSSVGFVLLEISEYDKVELLCRKLFDQDSILPMRKVTVWLIYAVSQEKQGLLDSSEYYCELSKPILDGLVDNTYKRQQFAWYYRTIAKIAYKRGEYSKAVEMISIPIEQYPESDIRPLLMAGFLSDRGVYYTSKNDFESAIKDFELAEQKYVECNMPPDTFILLYSNISCAFSKMNNYDKEEEYLKKIVEICPAVLEPVSVRDATICNNIATSSLHKHDNEVAEKLFLKAAAVYEALEATHQIDYLTIILNLALTYEKLEMYEKSCDMYDTLFELYDEKLMDIDGYFRMSVAICYIQMLLAAQWYEIAHEFADKEDAYITGRFGENSIQRAEYLFNVGANLKEFSDSFCVKYLMGSHQAIKEGGHENTVLHARVLNYVGVCYTDYYENYGLALIYFNDSKNLFEKLNVTEDEMYKVVLSNIEYAQNKQFDKLMDEIASNASMDIFDDE